MPEQVPPQTLSITNFRGRLVKQLFGDINSGNSPLGMSHYGNNPFWDVYEGSLSFMTGLISTVGSTTLLDPIMRMVGRGESNSDPYVYGIGYSGNFYRIQAADTTTPVADKDTITAYTNNLTASAGLQYGGGIGFYGGNLYVGYDTGVSYLSASNTPITDAAWTAVTSSGLTASRPHPVAQFLGNLYVGNDNNIAESTNGTSFATLAKFSPALPSDWVVRDLAVSQDGAYLVILASGSVKSLSTLTATAGNQKVYSPFDSAVILWNGQTVAYNSIQFYKGVDLTSIAVSNTGTVVFGKDAEGVGVFDLNGNRLASLFDSTNNSNSISNATYSPTTNYVMGKKIFFISQYGATNYVYCYDMETGDLYPIWGQGYTAENIKGAIVIPSVHASNISGTDLSRSKLYFSISKLPISTQGNNLLYRLHLNNYGGAAINGYYSTQVQKLYKKVNLKEVRIYCKPTVTNNAFTFTITGEAEGAITGTASFNYSFAAGTDKTKAQGSLDLIKFSPGVKNVSSVGVQINNTGTVGIIIHKIEIDYVEVGQPQTTG